MCNLHWCHNFCTGVTVFALVLQFLQLLHWCSVQFLRRCYSFCTGVTLFAVVLHLNCTALSHSESSNFSCVLFEIFRSFRDILEILRYLENFGILRKRFYWSFSSFASQFSWQNTQFYHSTLETIQFSGFSHDTLCTLHPCCSESSFISISQV